MAKIELDVDDDGGLLDDEAFLEDDFASDELEDVFDLQPEETTHKELDALAKELGVKLGAKDTKPRKIEKIKQHEMRTARSDKRENVSPFSPQNVSPRRTGTPSGPSGGAPPGFGGPNLPPPGPPTPPGGGQEGPSEGPDEDPDDAIIREQQNELRKMNREFRRMLRRERIQSTQEERVVRRRIQKSRQDELDQIKDISARQRQEGASASDRIVRRLSAFGLARGIGQSGQMFAALAEMFVFQPEELAAERRTEALRMEKEDVRVQAREEQRSAQERLDEDLALRRMDEELRKQEMEDILEAAQEQMGATDDIDQRQAIIDEARRKIREQIGADVFPLQEPTGTRKTTGESPGVFKQETDDQREERLEREAIQAESREAEEQFSDTIDNVNQKFDEAASEFVDTKKEFKTTIDSIGDDLAQWGDGLQESTKIMLAANVALEAMNIVSETVTGNIREFGQMLTGGPSGTRSAVRFGRQTGSGLVGLFGGIAGSAYGYSRGAQDAGRAASFGAGIFGAGGGVRATAGRAVTALASLSPGTMALMLAGSAVGSGGAKAVYEPIVEAIEQGNAIMEDFSARSIAPGTAGERAEQNIRTTLRQIAAFERVDPETRRFTSARGELERSIIDLKTTLIQEFGDDITLIVQYLSFMVKWADSGFQLGGILETFANPFKLTLEGIQRVLEHFGYTGVQTNDILQSMLDRMTAAGIDDAGLQSELEDFFGTMNQFRNNRGRNPNDPNDNGMMFNANPNSLF